MMPLYRQNKFVIKTRSMKKNWMIWGLAAMALMSSCTDQKTAPTADNDTTSVAQDTASIDSMDLTSIAGTYEDASPPPTARASRPCSPSMPTAPTS